MINGGLELIAYGTCWYPLAGGEPVFYGAGCKLFAVSDPPSTAFGFVVETVEAVVFNQLFFQMQFPINGNCTPYYSINSGSELPSRNINVTVFQGGFIATGKPFSFQIYKMPNLTAQPIVVGP